MQRLQIDWKQDASWAAVQEQMESHGWRLRQSSLNADLDMQIEVYSRQSRGPLGRFRRREVRIVAGKTTPEEF